MAFELWKQFRPYSALQVLTAIQEPAWIPGFELVPSLSVGGDARPIAAEGIPAISGLASFTTATDVMKEIEYPPKESFLDCFVQAIRHVLPEREQGIVASRFGLMGERPQMLQQIASTNHISSERVRQLQDRSLRRLCSRGRNALKKHDYKAPCAQLCLCVDDIAKPRESGEEARIFAFTRDILGHLTDRVAARLVLRLLGYKPTVIDEKWQKICEIAEEDRAKQKEQARLLAPQRKFLQFLDRHVEWFSEPYLMGFTPDLARRREVNDYENSGTFYSDKLNRDVKYESQLELEFLVRLDQTDAITYFQEQPLAIGYELDGKSKRYFPDVLFALGDGRAIVTEIKPTGQMGYHSNLSKWKAVKA